MGAIKWTNTSTEQGIMMMMMMIMMMMMNIGVTCERMWQIFRA
jgi:hypothetical protein